MEVEAEPAEGAALGEEHAVGAAVGDGDRRGDRHRLVLEDDDRVLREAAHAGEQELRGAGDELGAAGELGVEPFVAPVVEREHVVLAGLDEEQALQLAELVGLLGGEVVGLGPVVGAVQLPHVVVERRQLLADPRGAVAGAGRPALVVDAAVDERLEVLRLVAVRRRRRRRRRSAC